MYKFNEEIIGNEEVKENDLEKWFDTIFNRDDCTMWGRVLAIHLFLCRAEVLYPSCRRRRYRLLQMGIYSPRHTETDLFARLTFLLGIGGVKVPYDVISFCSLAPPLVTNSKVCLICQKNVNVI